MTSARPHASSAFVVVPNVICKHAQANSEVPVQSVEARGGNREVYVHLQNERLPSCVALSLTTTVAN